MYLRTFCFLVFLLSCFFVHAQDLHLETFGDSTDPSIIYLHGGPGGNSLYFEHLIAPKLADEGFYVISYDRRGEGRSRDTIQRFFTIEEILSVDENLTFRTVFRDIDSIIDHYNLEKPTLLGNSFGGNIALLYADSFSHNVNAVIISGTPLNYKETNIYLLQQAKDAYSSSKDSSGVEYMSKMLNKVSSDSLADIYGFARSFALSSGAIKAPDLTEEAKEMYAEAEKDSLEQKFDQIYHGGFGSYSYKSDINYTIVDFYKTIAELQTRGVGVHCIYSHDEPRISSQHIEKLKNIVSEKNVLYLDQSGHAVLWDRRTAVISAIREWLK